MPSCAKPVAALPPLWNISSPLGLRLPLKHKPAIFDLQSRQYGPVLYVHPPSPALGAFRGTFPHIRIPAGRVELWQAFGMLWSAAPAPEEAATVGRGVSG